MLGLSATYNYFLSYGRVDMHKGCFMHSILESCSMNKISPYGYLEHLLQKYKTLTEEEKPALMPCYYKNNLKI